MQEKDFLTDGVTLSGAYILAGLQSDGNPENPAKSGAEGARLVYTG